MIPFDYAKPGTIAAAVTAVSRDRTAKFIAGGTNLVDLMKRGVMNPEKLVDITGLPMNSIAQKGNMVSMGSLVLNSAVAENKIVVDKLPLLSQALKTGASAQIRNMATVGGNINQRTRCPYFYDTALPCNKREPGTGCSALQGYNRMHAILGTSDSCIAVHPSDMSVALAALDATVVVQGARGERRIPFTEYHRLPGTTPHIDNNLQHGELVTGIEVPVNPAFAQRSLYTKVRDRASYAFALVSVAAALDMRGKTIQQARLAMGGVAHKPWRLTAAEQFLRGKEASEANFRQAASLAMREAKGYGHNNFKLTLAPNTIIYSLKKLTGV